MRWILFLISILWISAGSCLILYTIQSKDFLKRVLGSIDPEVLSIIPIVIGILLVGAAYYSAAFWTIIIIGLLAIGKGLLLIFNPGKTADKLTSWFFHEASDNAFRLFGIFAIILGTALLSWI